MEKKFRTFSPDKSIFLPINDSFVARLMGESSCFCRTERFSSFKPIVEQMSPKAKKYLITTETHEIFIVRRSRQKIRRFCFECGKEVEMLNLDSAVSLTGKRASEIFRLVENGEAHSLKTTGGQLLVCRSSLAGEIK